MLLVADKTAETTDRHAVPHTYVCMFVWIARRNNQQLFVRLHRLPADTRKQLFVKPATMRSCTTKTTIKQPCTDYDIYLFPIIKIQIESKRRPRNKHNRNKTQQNNFDHFTSPRICEKDFHHMKFLRWWQWWCCALVSEHRCAYFIISVCLYGMGMFCAVRNNVHAWVLIQKLITAEGQTRCQNDTLTDHHARHNDTSNITNMHNIRHFHSPNTKHNFKSNTQQKNHWLE